MNKRRASKTPRRVKRFQIAEETEEGRAIRTLPSPYQDEKIVIRKKEVGRGTGIELRAMRLDQEGKEIEVGIIGIRKTSHKDHFKIPTIGVERPYRRAGIGTTLESIAREVCEKEVGGPARISLLATDLGPLFWEQRGYPKGKGSMLTTEMARLKVEIKTGRERLAMEPQLVIDEIKKCYNSHAHDPNASLYVFGLINKMIEGGKLQKLNFRQVQDLLKKEGLNKEANLVKYLSKYW